MSSPVAERQPRSVPPIRVVDLTTVRPVELEPFWERDVRLWRERLFWDERQAIAMLRRSLERGHLHGRAARIGERVVGFSYYLVEGRRGVVSGFGVTDEWEPRAVARVLLKDVVRELSEQGVERVETQFMTFDGQWLNDCLWELGFTAHWRQFLRRTLPSRVEQVNPSRPVVIEPWGRFGSAPASAIMAESHVGRVDAQMNELYRSGEGCRLLLDNIMQQRGCGLPLPRVSAIARLGPSGPAVGFCLVTETMQSHAHLAQLAVLPQEQRCGVGESLLRFSLARLEERQFQTISLMVSRDNLAASNLYSKLGFREELTFPVFCRDGLSRPVG